MCDQKVALVTGVSSGIGRAVALLLSSRGFRVFGTVRHLSDSDTPARNLEFIPLDVRDEEVGLGVGVAVSIDIDASSHEPPNKVGLVGNACFRCADDVAWFDNRNLLHSRCTATSMFQTTLIFFLVP